MKKLALDPVRTQLLVNDVHARLSRTRVHSVRTPESPLELAALVTECAQRGLGVTAAGGRHAMGSQAFGTDAVLVDTHRLTQVRSFDPLRGIIEVDAGIRWPELIEQVRRHSAATRSSWSIAQKQTGADRMSLAGSLSANAHGRGLTLPPISAQVLGLTLVDASGALLRCDREANAELFRLVLGGYGLFGLVATVRLQLVPATRVRRRVVELDLHELAAAFDDRIAAGHTFGDFQFAIDPGSPDFLRKGVFSCYQPTDDPVRVERRLSQAGWMELLRLAHVRKSDAFTCYRDHYLATDGQVYESDTHQLAEYLDDYHVQLDPRLEGPCGTEMITELYVPRHELVAFAADLRATLRKHRADLIYGTIRLIERDVDSYLAWAREPWACVVMNLHVEHSERGKARARDTFRALIDRALGRGGSFYLTYHRWARRDQLLAAYPQLPDFLAAKLRFDPEERFRSDWYRHHRELIGSASGNGVPRG